ncbi:uncharacterized protein EV154DRAFT_119597 [Mucor mucedo]|uniref:uncharacterized protein n=1 Tax=Mucor mucedo TaxID=29922 RepID=UPI00221FC8D0|nr:uncharacterized protein EV154DRAFT_119597 [Mucor mucedo]KAI7893986.1 hypothetical protein EV154DRAFT_119597 [Mucor mucedo]
MIRKNSLLRGSLLFFFRIVFSHYLPSTHKIMYHPYQQEQPVNLNHQEQKDVYYSEEKQKRKQSLEKNRLAAYRCRERKKQEQQQMVDQADILSLQNESLHIIVNNLKNEVISLRELLLAHDTCDCERVQSFIQKSSSLL